MPRRAKREPIEAFEDNFSDARALVSYVRAFSNNRARRMRSELRGRIGEALRISVRAREELDCLESEDLFVIFKPDGHIDRDAFQDLRPLLRQAIVAACASLETFLADKVMCHAGASMALDDIPKKLRDITLTVGHWADIERTYERRSWGIRGVIEESIRERSSTAPNQVGFLLGMIGVNNWAKKIDGIRRVAKGTTVKELEVITDRRNRIAHSADKSGLGRAALEIDEVEEYLNQVKIIVNAIDHLVDAEWS